MRCIVSGYIGFDNFGDEAIAHALVQKLRNEGIDDITLISSNPEKTAKLYSVKSCSMLKFLPSLIKSDVLISGGGSLLQDVTSLKSLIYYLGVIYSALILRKKVEIFAQGIGPINSKVGRFLTKKALKHCYKISVRDTKSQALLRKWGIEPTLVKDPVLESELPNKNCTGTLGVQLREFKGVTDEFLTKLADDVKTKFPDKKIRIISLQDSIDLKICEKFADLLKLRGLESEVLSGLSVNEVFELISNLEYLISMRFHACVVGIKSGIKVTAINYDPKIQSLAEEYNLPMIELKN